jgi:hypothetical protein
MGFDPYNHSLKIQESIGTLTSKVGIHFGNVEVHSLAFSHTHGSMKFDSHASLLARTFASPCFGCEPILHSSSVAKYGNATFIIVKHCEFCNRGFHSHDIVVASYKHTFYPFCLAKILKDNNKCLICGEILHPNWWTN